MDSIGEVRQYKDNLVITRLLLALAVVWSHAYPFSIGVFDPVKGLTGFETGWWAVNGFIAISGYCILESRRRSRSGAHFLWKRFLRVYPPYAVCMALLMLAYKVILTTPVEWFDLFTFGPVAGGPVKILNFPTWTVRIEECIYLAVAALFAIRLSGKWTWVVAFLVCYLANYWRLATLAPGEDAISTLDAFIRLIPYFSAGALLQMLKVPFKPLWIFAAAAVLIGGSVLGFASLVGPICLPYVVLGLGLTRELFKMPDLSYGVYLWGWPVMVFLAVGLRVFRTDPTTLFLVNAAICLAIAGLNHLLLEKPLRALRNRVPWGTQPNPPPNAPPEPAYETLPPEEERVTGER